MADVLTGQVQPGWNNYVGLYRLASELLARRHEGLRSCCPNHSNDDLKAAFEKLEAKIGLLDRLEKLRDQGDISKIEKHPVLAFMADETVEISGFAQAATAVKTREDSLQTEAASMWCMSDRRPKVRSAVPIGTTSRTRRISLVCSGNP